MAKCALNRGARSAKADTPPCPEAAGAAVRNSAARWSVCFTQQTDGNVISSRGG